MKRVIGGKRYDTDTAKVMAQDSHLGPRDFAHWVEVLYRKTTGEFFLHGIGGPASKYAEPYGTSGWQGGQRIMPLTLEEAKEWAEKHLDADGYEKIFGEVEEGGKKRVISLSLPVGAVEMIKRGAVEKGVTMSDYVAGLVMKSQTM